MERLVELRLAPFADAALRARTTRRGDFQRLGGEGISEGLAALRRNPDRIYQHMPYCGSKNYPTTVKLEETVVDELKELSKENGKTLRETINALIIWQYPE